MKAKTPNLTCHIFNKYNKIKNEHMLRTTSQTIARSDRLLNYILQLNYHMLYSLPNKESAIKSNKLNNQET